MKAAGVSACVTRQRMHSELCANAGCTAFQLCRLPFKVESITLPSPRSIHLNSSSRFSPTHSGSPAEQEQCGLSRPAVFRGGFTREAAERVVKAILPLLSSLFAKSLVYQMKQGRYDLHELVRQFAE